MGVYHLFKCKVCGTERTWGWTTVQIKREEIATKPLLTCAGPCGEIHREHEFDRYQFDGMRDQEFGTWV